MLLGGHARPAALLHGGSHERGFRAGTLPVPLIVGFGVACALALEARARDAAHTQALRDRLWARLQAGARGLLLNGALEPRLPANLNLSIEGIDVARLLLELRGFALSSGSACRSLAGGPSHVLLALGRSPALAKASLRFGLGRHTTEAEVDAAADALIEALGRLRSKA